jgi:hypothetical protein
MQQKVKGKAEKSVLPWFAFEQKIFWIGSRGVFLVQCPECYVRVQR